MGFLVENKFFVFCLIVVIFVISIIIFKSTTTPSVEEFIEIYWELSMAENLVKTTYIPCNADCSVSEIYRVGNIQLNKKDYSLTIFDSETPMKYDSLCIDFNQDGFYCDEGEGPLKERYTFSIGTNFFNVLSLKEDKAVIAHYPKDLTVEDFTIGFVIESHYTDPVYLDVNLLVNETLKKSEKLSVQPKQKIIRNFPVSLSKDGLYKIKVSLFVTPSDEEVFIDFLVNKESSQ